MSFCHGLIGLYRNRYYIVKGKNGVFRIPPADACRGAPAAAQPGRNVDSGPGIAYKKRHEGENNRKKGIG